MVVVIILIGIIIVWVVYSSKIDKKYKELEGKVFTDLGISGWKSVPFIDDYISVKSRQTLEKYDELKYFKESEAALNRAERAIKAKDSSAKIISDFLNNNPYKNDPEYKKLYENIELQATKLVNNAAAYRVAIKYVTSAGNNLASKTLVLTKRTINNYLNDPTLLMNKSELNKYLKEQTKSELDAKHREYYDKVNSIVDLVNENSESFIIKGSKDRVDDLIGKLFDRTVNSIKKVKSTDSEEWDIIGKFIVGIQADIEKEVERNTRILEYYDSSEFIKIKKICESLMISQREFNEYIDEKVKSIATLFGTRVARTETENEDEYAYIRPYNDVV